MVTTNISRKRGRPAAFDRNKAIEIALELFWEKGYDSVGVAELGKAIGINPPSLYKSFGSKHGLFVEAVQRYVAEDKGGFLPTALTGAETLNDAVRNILVQAAKSYSHPEKQAGCLILSGTGNCTDDKALATTEEYRRATRTYLAKTFLDYGAQDANSLADYVLIAMSGLSTAARQGIKRNTLLKTAERFATADIISQ
ncbi:hypothetical protein MNBD_GAMMA25-1307 [hydrothermal vent metagenome]|uniref:HTH tetR-type domain-containing protein n=1 Tax=hydrothermal vent metagenome TaxID=652676 RepID=A0A3B1B6K9_9ZZZZ